MAAETVALVPLNALDTAKTRLREALDPAERRDLVAWLARHVVAALRQSGVVDRVVVVSPDPAALDLFLGKPGVTRLRSDAGELNADLERARSAAVAEGARRALVALGDLPLFTPSAVRAVLARLEEGRRDGRPAVVAVPDRGERGTNALALAPADALPFAFGEGSLARHQRLARRAGIEPLLYRADEIAFDVDTPADLRELVERGLWLPRGDARNLTPSPLP